MQLRFFAHLEKSPEHIHTYSITPLSLWNAAALGMTPALVVERLDKYSKYPLPQNVPENIFELMGRFGKLLLETRGDNLVLRGTDAALFRGSCETAENRNAYRGENRPNERFRSRAKPRSYKANAYRARFSRARYCRLCRRRPPAGRAFAPMPRG